MKTTIVIIFSTALSVWANENVSLGGYAETKTTAVFDGKGVFSDFSQVRFELVSVCLYYDE